MWGFYLSSDSWALERQGMVGFSATLLSGLPSGDFGVLVEQGIGPGVNVEYFINNYISVGGNFGYLLFQSPSLVSPVYDTSTKAFDWPITQEWKTISYGVFGKLIFTPEKEFSFYGKGNLMKNSYKIKYERRQPLLPSDSTTTKNTATQISAGLGVTFDYKKRLGMFAEFLYSGFLEKVKGLKVQFFSFNIGVTFYFGGKKTQKEVQ